LDSSIGAPNKFVETSTDLLTTLTGQPLKNFGVIEAAKDWLVEE